MQRLVKQIGVPLSLTKGAVYNDRNQLLVRGFFTSDRVDEVGDIITRKATENAIPAYKQWGNIRYMHQPRPVATVERIGSADGLDWNEVEIRIVDKDAQYQVEEGLLKALSVGIFIRDFDSIEFTQDGGLIIHEYGLAEISLVDHPANYDAKLESGDKSLPWKDLVNPVEGITFAKALSAGTEEETMGNRKDLSQALEDAIENETDTQEAEVEETEVTEITASIEDEEVIEEDVEEEVVEEEVEETSDEPAEEVIEEVRSVETNETEESDVDETEVMETNMVFSLSEDAVSALIEGITRSVTEAVRGLLEEQNGVHVDEAVETEIEESVEEEVEEETEPETEEMKRIKALEDRLEDAISKATSRGALPDLGELPEEEETEVENEPVNLVERAKRQPREESGPVITPRTANVRQ